MGQFGTDGVHHDRYNREISKHVANPRAWEEKKSSPFYPARSEGNGIFGKGAISMYIDSYVRK